MKLYLFIKYTILLQIIFTVFKTQSTKGNFVTITKFTINMKNMFYRKFLIPALNQGKGMQLHEPRQPSQPQYWFYKAILVNCPIHL
jgi:hypothetical protein